MRALKRFPVALQHCRLFFCIVAGPFATGAMAQNPTYSLDAEEPAFSTPSPSASLEQSSVELQLARARRQYGARCGRSRSPSRSDGGDSAARSCGERIAAQCKLLNTALKNVAPHLPFYRASKGHITLYLLGTLHVGKASDCPLPECFRLAIRAALALSPILAFELDPDDLMFAQDDVQRYGMCAYNCLPRLVPAALWRRLAMRLRDNPAALAEIKKSRPWLAALMMDMLAARAAGLQTEYGTEAQLENIYTAGRIIGLETFNEQILAFIRLTRAEQLEMLAQSLARTLEQNAADMRALHDLWRAGDADKLAAWQSSLSRELAHSSSISKAIDEKTLYQRNRRFVAHILLAAEPGQPLFVAIGALHLGGPRGVLALLRQHGFDVRPG